MGPRIPFISAPCPEILQSRACIVARVDPHSIRRSRPSRRRGCLLVRRGSNCLSPVNAEGNVRPRLFLRRCPTILDSRCVVGRLSITLKCPVEALKGGEGSFTLPCRLAGPAISLSACLACLLACLPALPRLDLLSHLQSVQSDADADAEAVKPKGRLPDHRCEHYYNS